MIAWWDQLRYAERELLAWVVAFALTFAIILAIAAWNERRR
jgi:hypothetical protein